MTQKKPKTKRKKPQTRQAIVDLIKTRGPLDAETLAAELGISAMAVRQHLYDMQAEHLVTYEEEARPRGRPAKMWALTPEADEFYPNGHAQLIVSLLQSMGQAFGEGGLDKLLQTRASQQARDYKKKIKRDGSLRKRLEQLARIRTEEGYMADVETHGKGKYMLLENHCPICEAASACQGLCEAELGVFQEVLGTSIHVERVDHIQQGARRCAYRIEEIS